MHFAGLRAPTILVALLAFTASAQRPPAQPHAGEILHRMQKLEVVGSVLYIVAHPDDENTRLISWLANGKKVRTGNLSLTRGDGGQNLIGPELGDALGIIRTQELMEARRIDGGEQFFTRAVDFGFSKNAAESFEKWGKQEVLSDVVRVIRTFRPDVIITRFPPTREAGHGHHEASAILAAEAFDLAGDPKAFPEQLKQGLTVWQPRRLYFNGSTWWKKDLAEFAKTDADWTTVDVGGYDPLLGLSYTEIAGRSRSMHKSQGFGAAETRGEMLEYLHFEKGDRPKTKDPFDGIDMTWRRAAGTEGAEAALKNLLDAFDPEHPEASITHLRDLKNILLRSKDPLAAYAAGRVDRIAMDCLGLVVEMTGEQGTTTLSSPADSLVLTAMVRNPDAVTLNLFPPTGTAPFSAPLEQNHSFSQRFTPEQLGTRPVDEPFWLQRPHGGLYDVADPTWIGKPVLRHSLDFDFGMQVRKLEARSEGAAIDRWVDRVKGELIRPVYVTPVASVIPKVDVLVARGGAQTIEVEVEALTDDLHGTLAITPPAGWATTKDLKVVDIAKRGNRQSFFVQLIPMDNAQPGSVKFAFKGEKGTADRTLHEIDHPHILPQVYYTPAEVKLIPMDVRTSAKTVGYIEGAGDEVPEAIRQLGATVDLIDLNEATLESISKYDAIVVGIRAYNNNQGLKRFNPTLMKYAENGGTVVVQYTTRTNDMVLPDSLIGPYPFKLTRDRVTVEEAPPTFLAKEHPLLNAPNKITAADFDGWVQERGLYFCGSLDPHYTPLIAWNDPGEQPLIGGLITCDHGKGRYVYTGISFFRQLPAGVPGAYRLFANLISKRDLP